MIDDARLREAIDRSEILNVIAKSIITRDAGRWEELAECYHSDAQFISSWWSGKPSDFFAVADRKLKESRSEGGDQKHMTCNHWVEINGDRACAEGDVILFMRSRIKGVELDVTTWSRRLQLLKQEAGRWKIFRRWIVYERDRIDPVDPKTPPEAYIDEEALAKYPHQLRFHLWRNDMIGSPADKKIVLKGSKEEVDARQEIRDWMAGKV